MAALQKFRNVIYPYKDQDDTFIARGYHLNLIVDAFNAAPEGGGQAVELPFGDPDVDIILGVSADTNAVNVLYAANYPDAGPSNMDSAGKLIISNGAESDIPRLEWEHDSTRDNTSNLTLTPMVVGDDLVLRVSNLSGNTLHFSMNSLKA